MILYLSERFDVLDLPTLMYLYFDFEKAFDKVSYEKLLETLEECRVKGVVIDNLQSYLKGRT